MSFFCQFRLPVLIDKTQLQPNGFRLLYNATCLTKKHQGQSFKNNGSPKSDFVLKRSQRRRLRVILRGCQAISLSQKITCVGRIVDYHVL